jgi:hypothetical protein
MPIFEKDVLYPGEYRLADGRRVEYTREDVAHLKQRLKDMTAAGLQVPVAWEHQDEAKPKSEAERRGERAKWNLGFALDAEETGEGYLVARIDVPNGDDAVRLPSVRFASPEIAENYTDGSGKVWPGKSITHIAVTPRPVQHHQQPFKSVQLSGGVVRLSLTDRLSDEKNKTKEEGGGDGQSEADAKFQECLDCLRNDGYGLPDDTTPENLIERLHTAALTKRKVMGDQYGGAGGMSNTEGVSPVTMSLEQKLAAREAELLKLKRENLVTRIGVLFSSGRIPKLVRDKLLNEANTAQLSLGDDGQLKDVRLLAKVEALEDLPANFGQADRLSTNGDGGITAVDPPEGMAGPPRTREEANRVVDEHFEFTGSTQER